MIDSIFLLVFLLILLFLAILTLAVKAHKTGKLRPLPGLKSLPALVQRSAEMGRPLHVSVGVAGMGGTATAETWAGLTLLGQLADEAAACDASLIVTVADATVLPIAQDILQRAHARYGNLERYDPTQVRFIAPDPAAYAMGVMGMLEREPLAGNIMVGTFGDEYLLMGETAARLGLHQVAGTADPQTLPLVYATADETLVGEEMFAGGAYTSRLPIQVGSLLVEDWLRWLVIVAIVVTAIWKIVA